MTLFFSNANISPHEEFLKRLDSVKHLAKMLNVPLIVDDPDHADWLERAAKGFEREKEKGLRCDRCFHYSLRRTYAAMLTHGFDRFTTTLSVSPHKHTPTLFVTGRDIDEKRFLSINFKKDEGFKNSLRLAAEYGLYRQNHCGCEFSARP